MIPGIDLLGMAHVKWNIKATVQALKATDGINIGLFADETFGPNAIKNAIKCLDTGKVKAIRAQLNWSGPNPKHQLPPLSKIKKLAPEWEKLAKKYPSVKFYVSPSCEPDSNDTAAIKAMLELTQQLCPSCTVVYNPMTAKNKIPGYVYELHGDKKMGAGQAISYDGGSPGSEGGLYNIDAARWVKQNSKTEYAMAWAALCNMQEAHNTKPPKQRTESPSREFILGLIHLFDEPGSAMTPNFPVIPLKKPLLYKSFAEDSPGADKRHNRPMILAKQKAPFIELYTYQNQLIGRMPYYGGFGDGLSRYYSGAPGGLGLYGWQIAKKCEALSGSPWGYFQVAGKYYGPIHFTFRGNYF